MNARFRALALCVALVPSVLSGTLAAQETAVAAPAAAKADTGPWLYRGSDIPQDKEWVFGELPNGLRYAVRKNGVPPGQVSIRVRVDAGSLNEADSERGYAHFIEHLVFRQSKYIGEAQAIPTWQRLGATFGSDTNAETTPVATTYKLDLPNASASGLDETFKLLSGMMIHPTLSDANIKAELPIVLAEKRERGGAAGRVDEAMRQAIYAGQPLANRAPIGTEATLSSATRDSVRAFHKRWYRPENTVVIVAGDRAPEVFAELIAKWFSDWPVTGPTTPAPSFGDPVAPADATKADLAPVGEVKVVVEPDLPRVFTWATLRPWRPVTDNIAYNQGLMTDALGLAIINRRLEARARAGGSYLAAQVNQQDVSRSVDGTFVVVTPLGADWQTAVKDVRGVIADALASPPTQEEIDREVAEMRIAFTSSAEQRELLSGSKVADDIVQALDIRETVADPVAVLDIFERTVKLFTPEAVLRHTRAQFEGTVTRGVYVTPGADEASEGALRTALSSPVAADGGSRLAYKQIKFSDLPAIGKPGKPVPVATGLSGIEQVNFANGVKAIVWPSTDEPGRVTVKVRFGAGYRAFRPEDAAYAALGDMALVSSGVSVLGQEDLDRVSTGRKMGFDFGIDDADFTFSASTRRDDLADQLYLLAAKLAMPRWDAQPVQRAKAALKIQYEAYASSPQGVLERDLKWLERDRDPRYKAPTPAEVDKATPERFKEIWSSILASGPVEVQVFGDIDRDETVAALSRTFGALKPRKPLAPAVAGAGLRVPAGGGAPIVLSHHGEANQAAAMVYWPTGAGFAGIREGRQLRILSEVFSNRLLDRMREKLGASYSPQVYSTWPVELNAGGTILALAQIEPKDVATFYAAADEIAADLVARPPSADELERVTEPLRQQITRAATGSAYLMYHLEGATQKPELYEALRTLMSDSTNTTPEAMQQLAAKYLLKDRSWRLAVLPKGQSVVAGGAVLSTTR
ncbi:pitrilysin family protein [Novosphingobium sp. TH158]|uniref:M16 family metallopeptidase n=1 Tax=Novosphingobium sp. TH158 TaxID=2067455 RepID=UPI000C7D75B0|nr:M16 family metallopeptidase [Novosphingobium sp. TH158]PLK26522.1 peptidase M16 [Novosphingobium sp. TH158]